MKKILVLIIILKSFSISAQSVSADPALGQVLFTTASHQSLGISPTLNQGAVYLLKVPIRNLHPSNAIPSGTTKVKVGLGSKLQLNPTFNINTAATSNKFQWTAADEGGQVQLTGDQLETLPANYSDTAVFEIIGTILGNSTVTANFLVTNHNSGILLSDENGANNLSSQVYQVIQPVIPVTFTGLELKLADCRIRGRFFTENEVNVKQYEIETSKDGVLFVKKALVDAAQKNEYHFEFTAGIESTATVLYVRIKSVDIDGKYQYSQVKSIILSCDDSRPQVHLLPNPISGANFAVQIITAGALFNGRYELKLIDASGRLVAQETISAYNQTSLYVSKPISAAGIYIVHLKKQGNAEKGITLKAIRL